jgi:large subunit ribosomal protein L3
MPTIHRPKYGSMAFWPRKRIRKVVPDVNWEAIKTEEKGPKGLLGYKVGMVSVVLKDNTPDSMTKGKKIVFPATIVECPEMKIFSVRFYKNKKVLGEVVVSKDKELRKIVKVPKEVKKLESFTKEFDLKKDFFKKTPSIVEVGLEGTKEEKIAYIKEKLDKTLKFSEIFQGTVVDVRGVTKGKGFQGPVKRFGISLKSHKSEKGVRRPGSLGPWHPARVSFVTPMAGQVGLHTRIIYNNLILKKGDIVSEDINPSSGFNKYGKIRKEYVLLKGSVAGPAKREVLITKSLRAKKDNLKRKYDFINIA